MSTLEEPVGCNTVRLERIYSIRFSTKFYPTVDESRRWLGSNRLIRRTLTHTRYTLYVLVLYIISCSAAVHTFIFNCSRVSQPDVPNLCTAGYPIPSPMCLDCRPSPFSVIEFVSSIPRGHLLAVGIMFGVLVTKTAVVDKFSTPTCTRRKK